MLKEIDSILGNLAVWSACLLAMTTFASPMLRTYSNDSSGSLERLLKDFDVQAAYRVEGGKTIRINIDEIIPRATDSTLLILGEPNKWLSGEGGASSCFLVILAQTDFTMYVIVIEK